MIFSIKKWRLLCISIQVAEVVEFPLVATAAVRTSSHKGYRGLVIVGYLIVLFEIDDVIVWDQIVIAVCFEVAHIELFRNILMAVMLFEIFIRLFQLRIRLFPICHGVYHFNWRFLHILSINCVAFGWFQASNLAILIISRYSDGLCRRDEYSFLVFYLWYRQPS